MLLDTVNKKIQAKLVEAVTSTNPVFTTTYGDIITSDVTPGAGEGSFNGTTAVDLIAAPAASTFRHVKEIQINNTDTANHSFTVWILDGATSYTVVSSILVPAGASLRYSDTTGWAVGVALGSGTVSSVALSMPSEFAVAGSPITLNGTLAVSKATQAANTHYAGPASGTAAAPTFRAMSVNDAAGWNFTAGSVPFMSATGVAQDNANLFWDATNLRLGIGTAAPAGPLGVLGVAQTGVREKMVVLKVSDAGNDSMTFSNGTATDGRYLPSFAGFSESTSTNPSIQEMGLITSVNDIAGGTTGIVDVFVANTSSSTDPINGTLTAIVNRNLFGIRNFVTQVVTVKANGAVGFGTTAPATSALLDLTSTTGALLVPRMTTTQKNALTAVNGMVVYDTTLAKFQGYEAGVWNNFSVL